MEETLTNKQCSSSGGGYFDLIPFDLIIKIFLKLPGKSLGKCRCVSNLWSSIIRRPNYNQLFPIKSPDPLPRLLFAVEVEEKLYFYSIPQPEKQDDNSTVTATFHHADSRSSTGATYKFCPSVHGLVCQRRMEDENHVVAVISNPITGEYVTSPKLLTYGNMAKRTKTYFGYDPINKKFKVLCLTWSHPGNLQHQVLTLETNGKGLLWRQIPCCISYSPPDDGICINGILYYYTYTEPFYKTMIICFDVMSEKFDFVTDGTDDQFELNMIMLVPPTLINYKGKLAACAFDDYNGFVWVLEEHKWSKHIYKMPLQWRGLGYSYDIGGVTSSGEVVSFLHFLLQSRDQHCRRSES